MIQFKIKIIIQIIKINYRNLENSIVLLDNIKMMRKFTLMNIQKEVLQVSR